MGSTLVSHPGIVLGWEKERLKVQIVTGSACGGCAAKGACPSKGSSETRDTEVLALPSQGENYSPFDRVEVLMTSTQGFKAVWWAFLLPLTLFLITIFTLGPLLKNDSFTAIAGLGVLGLSWGGLAFFHKYFSNQFVFQARRSS